jgi:hypothetical protein
MRKNKCSICEEEINGEIYYGDPASYEGEPLCEVCYYENEPCAVVYFGKDETPYQITPTRNETDGLFRVRWIRTDPWRGYYTAESDEYSLINTAELLAYHQSEEMLAEFDRLVRELFDEHGIDYARVFCRSSNVFFQNYEIFVKREQVPLSYLLIMKAKREVDYDNPKWYRGIIFDEKALETLRELFPEKRIETDYDAAELVEKCYEDILKRLDFKKRDKE